MPTVYGTLKATMYSFLFGAPLAILAALYTSEFLRGRVRSRIKSSIEMMASLPSVVLGFLAAIVIAPIVDAHLAGTLAAFVCVPFTFVLGGYLWRLLPYHLGMSWSRFQFPILFLLGLPLGAVVGTQVVGPWLENWLFLGDLKTYLHGAEVIPNEGKRFAGWLLILLPLSALTVSFVVGRLGRGFALRRGGGWDRRKASLMELVRFLVVAVAVIGVAALFANLLSFAFDPRGPDSILNTYDQRNALVVGFIMGFAIIPIIYTIAEDALSTVPEHLRAASLGAGATPWQTAIRIVMPTAMSGLFSAMMIGLGRAVGETMIIVMATGGTPIMEPNLFNGFRTLSANIATELPEAPPGSTHYRTLFVAALVLFVMTFVLNTVAELVRLRFRKKAFEL
ncbi:MAG: ABC transporter permease subunit [Planctomycetes bacterium]|nr:ABC transporter permease subunit [Planctomycetota bacterium]